MNGSSYNRIMLVGNNGSGKSYVSSILSELTGIPVIHLDARFWGPNWTHPSENEWIRMQKEYIAEEKWIIDGNHTGTMELRFAAADAVIFLDINRFVCLWGVLRRQNKKRADMPDGLKERFDRDYLRFLKGLWDFSKTRKHKIMKLHEEYPDKPFYIIKNRKEIRNFLQKTGS